MSIKVIITSGKRKQATARAIMKPGTGVVTVNKKPYQYISQRIPAMKIQEPILLAGDAAGKVDVEITVSGGGYQSQGEAARLALARAFTEFSPRLKETFLAYDRQLLVADVRHKESAKPNSHGQARSKVQKSYR